MSSLKTTSLNNGLSEMDWDNTFFFPLFVVSGFRGSRDVRHTDVLPVGRLGTAVDKKTGKSPLVLGVDCFIFSIYYGRF